jgi:hypothetical protein
MSLPIPHHQVSEKWDDIAETRLFSMNKGKISMTKNLFSDDRMNQRR